MTFAPRTALLGFLGASLAMLATAYGFEYLGGLKPCVLCLYQRVPYGLAAGIALGGFFFAPHRKTAIWLLLLLALVFFANGVLAFYHVGVEQGWFVGTEACGGVVPSDSLAALRESLLNTSPARCNEIAWSLFGISMAGYNFMASIGLTAAAVAMTRFFAKSKAV